MTTQRLAVAALSARWMAQSALRGGRRVVALDLFGDLDTRRAARAWHSIGDPATLRIDAALLAGTLDRLHAAGEVDAWIAGPGADGLCGGQAAAPVAVPLIGNPRDAAAAMRDARRFFALLDRLDVPHPPVAFEAPADRRGWLQKDAQGSGGWHIECATSAASEAAPAGGRYFQQRRAGRSLSTLFVADGRCARLIGFAEQRIESHAGHPFVYAGAVGPIAPPAPVAAAVQSAVEAITGAAGLVGLNSLDFLLDGEDWFALEVNPRPSATVELYDPYFERGLLQVHLDACVAGRLPERPALPLNGAFPCELRGTRIVFAASPLQIDAARLAIVHALDACADVPAEPLSLPAGAPLCSVNARGATPAEVQRRLDARARHVLSSMETRSDVRLPV
jgi:uncharacterized protein